jgi:hypothetical protein
LPDGNGLSRYESSCSTLKPSLSPLAFSLSPF